jgi:histidyl-tRNA synthetase
VFNARDRRVLHGLPYRAMSSERSNPAGRAFQAPKGMRDLYPRDMARRLYITQAWRDTAIRHGFEWIDGPTFETTQLYTVKSGEGIAGEMFGVFSGKAEEEVKRVRETGRAPFALRPELTPTLARMYAARAGSLPRPTKWFSIGPFFRAERPQRGRLREFLQWNCDIVGGEYAEGAEGDAEGAEGKAGMDAELIGCCVDGMKSLGLSEADAAVHLSDRHVVMNLLRYMEVPEDSLEAVLSFLDRADRMDSAERATRLQELSFDYDDFGTRADTLQAILNAGMQWMVSGYGSQGKQVEVKYDFQSLLSLRSQTDAIGLGDWRRWNVSGVVRGLAYYTGTVFEVIAEGERAVAGGGRYDGLIELFGGPPTPAVGFAMGDAVLSLLLEDKGLMPEGAELLDAVSRPPASWRPDAFVFASPGFPDSAERGDGRDARTTGEGRDAGTTGEAGPDAAVKSLVAELRRGRESEAWQEKREAGEGKPWDRDRYEVPPLHARRSYKATRNVGKLLKEAASQHARTAVILENPEMCTIKRLDTGEQDENVPVGEVGRRLAL